MGARRLRQPVPARLRAQPASAGAGGNQLREGGCQVARGAAGDRAGRRPHRVFRRALGACRRRRRDGLHRADELAGRLQLPRAGATRRGPAHLPLDQPGLSDGTAVRARLHGGADPVRALRGTGDPGGVDRRHLRGFPARGGPQPLRRYKAGGGAADRGVRRGLWAADGDRPLRRYHRALADGQGRSGRLRRSGSSIITSASR